MSIDQELIFEKLEQGLRMALEAAHELGANLDITYNPPSDDVDHSIRINDILDKAAPVTPVKVEATIESSLSNLYLSQAEREHNDQRSFGNNQAILQRKTAENLKTLLATATQPFLGNFAGESVKHNVERAVSNALIFWKNHPQNYSLRASNFDIEVVWEKDGFQLKHSPALLALATGSLNPHTFQIPSK